jgi:hypothetical protein
MKKLAILINLLVVCSLVLTIAGTPGLAVKAARNLPALPDAVTTQIPGPIKQWLGLQRTDNGADTDIYPPAATDLNDPTILGSVPDTSGAVGYTHYLQAVNKMVALYQKDGTLVEMAPFGTFWSSAASSVPPPPTTLCLDPANHHGQPYVIYDHLSMRWVVMDVAYSNVDIGPYYLCIAVSKSNQPILASPPPPFPLPAGTYFSNTNWYYFAIPVEVDTQAYYPDQPKLSLWTDGYYISADLYDVQSNGTVYNYRGAKVWAVNRAHLINGWTSTFRYVGRYLPEQMSYMGLAPSNLLGDPPPTGTPNYFASYEPGSIYLWEFRVNWLNPDYSTFGKPLYPGQPNYTLAAPVGYYSGDRIVVPQPDTDELVDSHSERLMTPLQYRIVDGIPSLWAAYTLVDQDVTKLSWHEIQFAQDGSPNIVQTGLYKPDSTKWRWLPSLAVDRAGNMAMGYSISEPDPPCINGCPPLYPSIAYAGRLRTDAAGFLPLTENFLYKGTGSQYDSPLDGSDLDGPDGPWGRASQMSIDPLDDCVFWYTNMYYDAPADPAAPANYDWKTRIGFFALKECRGGATNRVSLSSANDQGNKASGEEFEEWGRTVAISADGRYVAFSSEATNLVADDTNNLRDVFVRDRDYDGDGIYDEPDAVQTVRITGFIGGQQSNGNSWEVSISSSGRYVAFSSEASNLVANDTNTTLMDVYVYDRQTGQMSRASSRDGTSNQAGNGVSDQPFIAGNGRYVAFRSSSSDLVTGDTNLMSDIFVRDLQTNHTYRVSLNPPSISPRQLAYESATPSLSDDGKLVAFASRDPNLAPNSALFGDTNLASDGVTPGWDVFVAEWATGVVTPISAIPGSIWGVAGTMAGAGVPGAESYYPYISGSGEQVAFASRAADLLTAGLDTNNLADIFVWDKTLVLPSGEVPISRVSVNFFGQQAINGHSFSPSISRDGRYVTFSSNATNLDAFLPDTNARRDIFLHDRGLASFGIYNVGYTQRISLDKDRSEANGNSVFPAVAALGDYVAFASNASDLVNNDSNATWDVFAYDFERSVPIFLRIPGNVPARPGDTVYMPVYFSRNGYNIDTTIFSVDFDETCLEFNNTTGAVTFYTPSDFIASYSYNAADTDGELDFSIYDQVAPRSALPDGTLATIRFRVKATCQAVPGSSNTTRVGFSSNPMPSFASFGQSIKGRSVDGFVRIQDGLPGDCNGDGRVDAADLTALVLEIFDYDGVLPIDTPGSTFAGNPVGCNPNGDDIVNAGDISCTVLISWGYTCGGSMALFRQPLESNATAQVELSLPVEMPVKPNSRVYLPVSLDTKDSRVSSLIFSLDYDETWLSFDDTDADKDGIPDAVHLNLPDGFVAGVSFDPTDKGGELDVAIYGLAVNAVLPDGALLTVALDAGPVQGTFLADVKSSTEPIASFGSAEGFSLPGALQDGSVWISNLTQKIYLPLVRK